MHEVYLRSIIEHAQTSCGMWSNPIGPSTRTRVQINHASLVRGWGSLWVGLVCGAGNSKGRDGGEATGGGAGARRARDALCTS